LDGKSENKWQKWIFHDVISLGVSLLVWKSIVKYLRKSPQNPASLTFAVKAKTRQAPPPASYPQRAKKRRPTTLAFVNKRQRKTTFKFISNPKVP